MATKDSVAKKKGSKRKPLTKAQLDARKKSVFKKKIVKVFSTAGFEYVPINDHHMHIGRRTVEIDAMFMYENIWLICEDTITDPSGANFKDHVRTKNEAFGEVKSYKEEFVQKLVELFPDRKNKFEKYDTDTIRIYGLYIPHDKAELTKEDIELFNNLIFVQPKTLNYFSWITQSIRVSARNEIFRFLGVTSKDIGLPSSSTERTYIKAPIIYPKHFVGTRSLVTKSKVRVVSFMMSAEDLLQTCYVMRKDNWEESAWLYQRLMDKNKIKGIREFIEEKGEAFYNNIIVALPDEVSFDDGSGHSVSIDEIHSLEPNCQLVLPKEMNSICVIDGQHRIYAHYVSGVDSKQEREISELRKQLHLLVTGLIFPKDMTSMERAKIQSEIFLDINSNAKPVAPNVLLHIQKIKEPLSDMSLAQFVIEELNNSQIFKNMFELSSLESGRIKTASIVKFALRYLVTLNPAEGKTSLANYWNGDLSKLKAMKDDAFNDYIAFCAKSLREYFCAVKKRFKDQWDDTESKLLSVICLNGFIIAYTRQLAKNGVKDFAFYDKLFEDWSYDFSKDTFQYTSSQYRMFSDEILTGAFKFTEQELIGK